MTRRTALTLAATFTLSAGAIACQGLKEAFTAHVDVAATAGSQELSVEHLAKLLAGVQVPLTPDIAKAIAGIWVDYQLLGQAAARNDTLNDPKLVDDALWALLNQERVQKLHEQIVKTYTGIDTSKNAAMYPSSDYLAAQHILLMVPPTATAAQRDSVLRLAGTVRAQLTAANFAAMAAKYSDDPGSKQRGGSLGVFQKTQMVPQFSAAVEALKPGQISQPVKTQYGYHLIRRNTYAEVREEFAQAISAPAIRHADSVYMAGLEAAASVKVVPNDSQAAMTVKTTVIDLDAHANDQTVLATWNGGQLTVARLVRWLSASPQKQQLADQVAQMTAEDVSKGIIVQVVRNELVLHAADSAKVVLDSAELATIRGRYATLVVNDWTQLGITPTSLADSGKTVSAREKIAAARADAYLDKLMQQQAQFVAVAPPVQQVAREKFGSKVNSNGLQRAIDLAKKEKAAADSAKAKARPATEVPIGGEPAAPSAAPSGKAAPAPKPVPPTPPKP